MKTVAGRRVWFRERNGGAEDINYLSKISKSALRHKRQKKTLLSNLGRATGDVGWHLLSEKDPLHGIQSEIRTPYRQRVKRITYSSIEVVTSKALRKAKAWKAMDKMKKLWKTKMNREGKVGLFKAKVEAGCGMVFSGSMIWPSGTVLDSGKCKMSWRETVFDCYPGSGIHQFGQVMQVFLLPVGECESTKRGFSGVCYQSKR